MLPLVLGALVNVILPVVLVASLGAVLGKVFPLDSVSINRVSLYGFTPALAFHSVMTTSVSFDQGARLVLAYCLAMAVAALLAYVAARMLPTVPERSRAIVVGCTIIGNNGNFGLPIALLALGQQGLDQALVIFVTSVVIMFTIGPALLGASDGLLGGLRRVVRLPVVWALVAALALRGLDLTPPAPVTSAVELLAGAAVPVVLLSLGIQLAQSRRIHFTAPVVTSVVLRTLAVPVLGYGAGVALGLPSLGAHSLLLACAMPTAVNAFMLAKEFGTDPETAASAVAVSTFVSIPLIAAVVAVLPALP